MKLKRFLAAALALLTLLALTACGSPEELLPAIGEAAGAAQQILETLAPTQAPAETDAPPLTELPAETETPAPAEAPAETETPIETEEAIPEDGSYTTKEDVALYIHTYGRLPDNFITKKQAQALGWPGGSLEPYAPGKCIGGDRFGNYEGLLPQAKGRSYTECDIDTLGASARGAKRIIFSNDGLIYYTDDHYDSFTLLYGDEGA